MCPPLCSAAFSAFVNFVLLVYAFSLPDWGPTTALIFVAPFAAAIVLLFFHWRSRLSRTAGWVLLLSGAVKIGFAIFCVVGAAQVGATGTGFSAIGALVFTFLAIASGITGAVDAWAGWSYAAPCAPGSRREDLLGGTALSNA